MNWREASKLHWQRTGNPKTPTTEQISCGALQRIADAVEKMSGNYGSLIGERDEYKRWYEEGQEVNRRMANRERALRGQITKLKRKLNPENS